MTGNTLTRWIREITPGCVIEIHGDDDGRFRVRQGDKDTYFDEFNHAWDAAHDLADASNTDVTFTYTGHAHRAVSEMMISAALDQAAVHPH